MKNNNFKASKVINSFRFGSKLKSHFSSAVAVSVFVICVITEIVPVKAYGAKKQASRQTEQEATTHQTYKEAETGVELRKLRRVGVGLQAAGTMGLVGAILELNLNPSWGFVAGYGGAEGYQALTMAAKYVLSGDSFLPYVSFGYTRWASVGKSGYINKTTPSLLADRLLSSDEKAAGEFQKSLLVPSIGIQFIQLSGDYAGTSIFAQIDILMDVGSFVAAPTGSLGLLYYF